MNYTENQLKEFKSFGVMNYPLSKCLLLVDDYIKSSFKEDFDKEGSPVHDAYHKGVCQAEYQLDMIIFQRAQSGDLKAIAMYEQRLKANRSIT